MARKQIINKVLFILTTILLLAALSATINYYKLHPESGKLLPNAKFLLQGLSDLLYSDQIIVTDSGGSAFWGVLLAILLLTSAGITMGLGFLYTFGLRPISQNFKAIYFILPATAIFNTALYVPSHNLFIIIIPSFLSAYFYFDYSKIKEFNRLCKLVQSILGGILISGCIIVFNRDFSKSSNYILYMSALLLALGMLGQVIGYFLVLFYNKTFKPFKSIEERLKSEELEAHRQKRLFEMREATRIEAERQAKARQEETIRKQNAEIAKKREEERRVEVKKQIELAARIAREAEETKKRKEKEAADRINENRLKEETRKRLLAKREEELKLEEQKKKEQIAKLTKAGFNFTQNVPAPAVHPDWLIPASTFARNGDIHGFRYFALFDYYPTRYINVPPEVQGNRELVWNFKDGKNTGKVAKEFASALHKQFNGQNMLSNANTVFVIIPASTGLKTMHRFQNFCSLVSKYVGITNGYSAVSVAYDREQLKGTIGANKIANLNFDQSIIINKKVLLFDDVKTTGGSFRQVANKLSALGASEIIGCFVATTYDSYKHGVPSWES